MSEQTTFVPLPRQKINPVKFEEARVRVDALIDWWMIEKPSQRMVSMTAGDWNAFKGAVGTHGVTERDKLLGYRGFTLYIAPR